MTEVPCEQGAVLLNRTSWSRISVTTPDALGEALIPSSARGAGRRSDMAVSSTGLDDRGKLGPPQGCE
jgi:hypothetical protein